eukprot:1222316-Alexandrium_andersonii.AAC.1
MRRRRSRVRPTSEDTASTRLLASVSRCAGRPPSWEAKCPASSSRKSARSQERGSMASDAA